MYSKPVTPLPVGAIIEDASRLYRAAFRRSLVIAVLGALVSAAFELFVLAYAHRAGLPLTGLDALLQTYQQPPVMALSLLETVVLLGLFGGLIVTANAVAAGDTRLTTGQAISIGFTRLGRCVLAALLSSLLILLGLLLIVPGLYLSGALALWPAAMYVDDAGALQSLEVSRRAVHGHWWHTSTALGVALLIVLLFSLLAGFVAGVLELSAGGQAGDSLMQLVSVLADVLMLPMLPAALVALYNDLKLRQQRPALQRRPGP